MEGMGLRGVMEDGLEICRWAESMHTMIPDGEGIGA